MPTLTIRRGETTAIIDFTGTPLLGKVLADAGYGTEQPCGGRGTCCKCAVLSLSGAVSPMNEAEKHAAQRLACQARLLGDSAVVIPFAREWAAIETTSAQTALGLPMAGRYGAAIDLGTTTLVARVFDLITGKILGERAALNPQTAVAADVMGRISAALTGRLTELNRQAQSAIAQTLASIYADAGIPGVDALTVAGNTAMLYLLAGRNPRALATAPFLPDELFGAEVPLLNMSAYLPPCSGAFMGADLTCAALATGLCDRQETTMLMDIGTNGELMLWHRGRLYAASTAAGPAFEGGEISQGCGGINGAIDRVWMEGAHLGCRVIGGCKAIGICGSGLLDAVAALLAMGRVDATGASDAPRFELRDGVVLTAGDIRAVQLAKAAVAAGLETLLHAAGATVADVKRLLLAGGFGSRLTVASAAAIGLIPGALAGKAHAVGNAALAGACALLLDTRLRARAEEIARSVKIIALGGDAGFEARFLAALRFPGAAEEE